MLATIESIFERRLSRDFGYKFRVAVNSRSSAIYLAFRSLRLQLGKLFWFNQEHGLQMQTRQ